MTDSLKFTALGATNQLTVIGPYPTGLFDRSIALVTAYSKLLSLYDDTSLLNQINHNAGIAPVKIRLQPVFSLIAQAVAWSQRQLGFNALLGPVVKLWHIGFADAKVPNGAQLADALALTDPTQVVIDAPAQTVYLTQPGMMLDLGGVAKGFMLDELAALWREMAVTGGVIDLAGNTMLVGNSEAGRPLWQVPIADPRQNHRPPLATLTTQPHAIVSSGIYRRRFSSNGRWYHHLLDPRSGEPVESNLASITVIAESALQADVLSSIGFYAGVSAGVAYIEKQHAQAIFITKDGQLKQTRGLHDSVTLTPSR